MRVRYSSIIVSTLIIFVSIFATAKDLTKAVVNEKEDFPQVVDYYQLMQMKEKDRIAYVTEVVRILSDLQAKGVYFSKAKEDSASAHSFLQWLLKVQSAQADLESINDPNGPAISTAEFLGDAPSPAGFSPAGSASGGTTVIGIIPVQTSIEKIITDDQKQVKLECNQYKCPTRTPENLAAVKKNFNERVDESKDVRCINAGMVSTYSVHGSEKCASVLNEKIGSLSLSCKTGETLCNPMLFGLKQDAPAKALCVPISPNTTRKCFELSGGPENAKKFWKRSDLSHEDLAEAWDNLRSNLTDDLCNEKASADYHCQECAIIAKRLRGLNKYIDKCPNICGNKISCSYSNMNSIKKLNNSDTYNGSR